MKEKKNRNPKYSLDELIKECDQNGPFSADLKEWLNAPHMGAEVLQIENDDGATNQ